jgi:hypothetical protein
VAVAARAFDVLDDNALGGQREGQRKIGAQVEHALRMCPDVQRIAGPLRHPHSGADGDALRLKGA